MGPLDALRRNGFSSGWNGGPWKKVVELNGTLLENHWKFFGVPKIRQKFHPEFSKGGWSIGIRSSGLIENFPDVLSSTKPLLREKATYFWFRKSFPNQKRHKNCQEKAYWCEILGAFFRGIPLSIPAIYIFCSVAWWSLDYHALHLRRCMWSPSDVRL